MLWTSFLCTAIWNKKSIASLVRVIPHVVEPAVLALHQIICGK